MFGEDMNGALRMLATAAQNYESGVFPPFSASFAQSVGGYPQGCVVADPTTAGLFWVSTADNNLTTPGADGASWVNLFAGLVANAGSANGGINGGITEAAIDGSTKGPTFRDGEGTWYQVVVCKGIYAATLDKSGAPSFLDEEGNWHIVQPAGNYQPAGDYQPAGNYLETDDASQQSVAGPVSFTQNPTGTTKAFGVSDTSFATTEFATRLNSGRLRAVNTFSSTGTYTPPRNDSTLVFRVRMVGGAGGGASAVPQDAYACSAGAGGTAGSYAEVWLTYSQLFSGATNTAVQVIIGSGGSANANGGQSSIGNAVICPGGYGAPNVNTGGYSTISPPSPFSASPNFPNGILFFVAAVPGQCGSPGNVVNPQNGGNFFALSGAGASSPMGVGGYAVGNGQDGIQGGPGGGGSGACGSRATSGTSAGQTGGTGGNGAAIIECYEAI
ncbi:hypothetical protein [Asaia sp. HumB]|uniref:hypothetical protein n=1 Tax=Asaia sp. HumB TaxID=3035475 RepID=UPI00255424EC|nr:hypothetical protein [Asaia sp. HumB]MDL2169767.1 hypothetical protein [Asaia sp. HumB]